MKINKQTTLNDSENNSPRLIRADERRTYESFQDQISSVLENSISKNPQDRYFCECNICMISLRQTLQPQLPNKPLQLKLVSTSERDFVFVLKRLLPTHRNPRSLNLNIPDTVCFISGEPRFIVYNHRETERNCQIRAIRDKLSLNQIRQFMNSRRKRYIEQEGKQTGKRIKLPDSQEQTQDRTKEAVVVQYDDDLSYILTEVEFLNLMMKRKGDPTWQHVQFVQNVLRQRNYSIQKVAFSREKDAHTGLFARGSIEPRQLSGDLVKGSTAYIPSAQEDEFQTNLRQKSIEKYLRYLTFKVVWYMECLYGARVEEGQFEWLQDERKDYYLINATNVIHTEVYVSFTTEEQFYQELERRALEKLRLRPGLEKYGVTEKTKVWQREMELDFGRLQDQVGINEDYFKIVVDQRSDQVFRQLHPECKHQFRRIVESQQLYNSMRSIDEEQLFSEKKHQPMLQSKMLNTFFLSPEKKKKESCRTTFETTKKELLTTMNNLKHRSAERTVSSFKLDQSRLSRSSHRPHSRTLNQMLGIV